MAFERSEGSQPVPAQQPSTAAAFEAAGNLWRSRAPYSFVARVTAMTTVEDRLRFEYELLDEDGSLLSGPIEAVLDASWWEHFRPLTRLRR